MTLIQNDRRPKNDTQPARVTQGDIRTLAETVRQQRVNATHVQPVVSAQTATVVSDTDVARLSGTAPFTATQTFGAGLVSQSGTTGSRPGSPEVGQQYFDITLGIPVWFNGTAWVNAAGVVV
jgi:hypothetical protein